MTQQYGTPHAWYSSHFAKAALSRSSGERISTQRVTGRVGYGSSIRSSTMTSGTRNFEALIRTVTSASASKPCCLIKVTSKNCTSAWSFVGIDFWRSTPSMYSHGGLNEAARYSSTDIVDVML